MHSGELPGQSQGRSSACDRLRQQLVHPEPAAELDDLRPWLDLLEGLTLQGTTFPRFDEAIRLLGELGVAPTRAPDHAAFEVLVRLGHYQPDENLVVRRAGVPREFLDTQLAEAHRLAAGHPWDDLDRLDLTSLFTVAIDDPETKEVDDALSARSGPGDGWTFWVHIADPGALLPPGSALVDEARRRGATLYLPEARVTMFPPELAEGPMSLQVGVRRAALTLRAVVDRDGRILQAEFQPSCIRVDHQLSYEHADYLLDEPGPVGDLLQQLHEGACALETRRRAAGALLLQGPEVKVRRAADGQINIRPVDHDSPSRALVAEMMILVGSAAARFFLHHAVPAIYRVQDAPDFPMAVPDGLLSAAVSYGIRRRLKRAELSRIPSLHAGLGVEPYVQISSPIRRYSDLLLQEQLKSCLATGQPSYDEEELLDRLGSTETTVARLATIEKESKRYWILRALERQVEQPLEAEVLEEGPPGYYLVELAATCLQATLEGPPGLPPGTRLRVAPLRVDARRNRIVLRWLSKL